MTGRVNFSLSIAMLVLAAAATPCHADAARITVQFGELNLEQPAGAATLYRRIRGAAERVCGEPRETGSRMIQPEWRQCVAQAVARAVVTLDRPTLTAYYRAHATQSFQDMALARR